MGRDAVCEPIEVFALTDDHGAEHFDVLGILTVGPRYEVAVLIYHSGDEVGVATGAAVDLEQVVAGKDERYHRVEQGDNGRRTGDTLVGLDADAKRGQHDVSRYEGDAGQQQRQANRSVDTAKAEAGYVSGSRHLGDPALIRFGVGFFTLVLFRETLGGRAFGALEVVANGAPAQAGNRIFLLGRRSRAGEKDRGSRRSVRAAGGICDVRGGRGDSCVVDKIGSVVSRSRGGVCCSGGCGGGGGEEMG